MMIISEINDGLKLNLLYFAHMKTQMSKGRPSTKPARLKDGFYVEIKNKGASNKIMMRSDDRDGMMDIVRKYQAIKDVTVLGEHKNDKWVGEGTASRKK